MSIRTDLEIMERLARELANYDYNDRGIIEQRAAQMVKEDIGDIEPELPLYNRRIRYPIGETGWELP